MNAFSDYIPAPMMPRRQNTLANAIGCVGVGLHSGARVTLRLVPAPIGHGLVFRRTDLETDIPARYDHVTDTRLCTVLSKGAARVGTVEHLMAALAACGVTNLLIEVDGPELPAMDGSSEPFLFLIECAGICEQNAPAPIVEVTQIVRVADGESFAELRPNPVDAFDLSLSIEFAAGAIGRQARSIRLSHASFRQDLARARTFTLRSEIEALQAAGLARGGSLDNAVVVDGETVLNPGGLRSPDEFVRHKLLDAVGDLALLGHGGVYLRGRMVAHRTGHALNNRLLRALFANPQAWRMAEPDADWAPLSAAA